MAEEIQDLMKTREPDRRSLNQKPGRLHERFLKGIRPGFADDFAMQEVPLAGQRS
jgi:hypothetical protein